MEISLIYILLLTELVYFECLIIFGKDINEIDLIRKKISHCIIMIFVFHAKMSLTKCSWILILRKNILHPLFLIYLKELTDLNEEKLNDE